MAQQIEYGKTVFFGNEYVPGTAAPEFVPLPHRETERKVVIPVPEIESEQTAVRQKVRNQQNVSPTVLVGLACAAVFLVFSLMAKIEFATASDETVSLEKRLYELEEEQNRLLIEYESVFNMGEIEKYASSQLGMQRPRDEQVFYISNAVPDKAVVVDGEEEKSPGGYLGKLLKSIG